MKLRVILRKGKQKELIETVKNKTSLTWKKFSEKLDCGQHYLSFELRNEKRTLSEKLYNKLCQIGRVNFNKFILHKLNKNWGQVKGGKNVKNRKNLFSEIKPRILCKPSRELAEILGIMLGDGSIYVLPEKGIYQVCVAGNKNDEKEYLLNYIRPLFEKVFKIRMNIKRTNHALYVWKQSKNLVFTLNKYGLPSGNKKKNNINIPVWMFDKRVYLKKCIRGIFDTDGCLYPKNKTHNYPTIWFSSAIPNLRKSITNVCKILGYNLSKWKAGRNDAYIGRKEEILRFARDIKFKNQKHCLRWKKFNKLPSSSPVNLS